MGVIMKNLLVSKEDFFTIEVWRPVVGFEGLYEVSSFGSVRSLPKVHYAIDGRVFHYDGHIVPQYIHNGYYQVTLKKDGHQHPYTVHRLVAKAFLLNPNGLPQVNHIDENRLNNNVNNLEWVTKRQNMNHGTLQQRLKLKRKHVQVNQYSMEGELLNTYFSIREAGRLAGVCHQSIRRCLLGSLKSTGGYKWGYTENVK